jgi:hypothetical protein
MGIGEQEAKATAYQTKAEAVGILKFVGHRRYAKGSCHAERSRSIPTLITLLHSKRITDVRGIPDHGRDASTPQPDRFAIQSAVLSMTGQMSIPAAAHSGPRPSNYQRGFRSAQFPGYNHGVMSTVSYVLSYDSQESQLAYSAHESARLLAGFGLQKLGLSGDVQSSPLSRQSAIAPASQPLR